MSTRRKIVATTATLTLFQCAALAIAVSSFGQIGKFSFGQAIAIVAVVTVSLLLFGFALPRIRPNHRLQKEHRTPVVFASITMTFFLAIPWTLVAGDEGMVFFVFTMSGFYLGIFAVFLIIAGWGKREGNELFCAKCHYQKGPNTSIACPECGQNWESPDNLISSTAQSYSPGMT